MVAEKTGGGEGCRDFFWGSCQKLSPCPMKPKPFGSRVDPSPSVTVAALSDNIIKKENQLLHRSNSQPKKRVRICEKQPCRAQRQWGRRAGLADRTSVV